MKNNVLNEQKTLYQTILNTPIKAIILAFFYFLLGLVTSRCVIWNSYAPFGVSFVSAVLPKHSIAAFLGAFIGYLIPSPTHGNIKYISSIVAIMTIRWALSELDRITKHPLYAPILSAFPIFITEFTMCVSENFGIEKLIVCITESLLAATVSYLFSETIRFFDSNQIRKTPNPKEICCICVTTCIVLLSLANVKLGYVSIGKSLAIIMIMMCARYAGVSASSIAGTACGLIFSLSSFEVSYVFGSLAFAGMMCGLFSFLGKPGIFIIFSISSILFSFQSADTQKILSCVYDSVFSGIVFMILPEYLSNKFSNLIGKTQGYTTTEGLRHLFTTRLNFASKAFFSVSNSVETIFGKLSKAGTSKLDGMCNKTAEDVCTKCGLKTLCWEENRDNTKSVFNDFINLTLKNGGAEGLLLPENFAKRCHKSQEIIQCINKYYNEYNSHKEAEKRISEFRTVLSEQFCGMGEILNDISNEFENYELFDKNKSDTLSEALRLLGLIPIDVSFRTNKLGAIIIEIELSGISEDNVNKAEIVREISRICGVIMDNPVITPLSFGVKIQITQKPTFCVDIGHAQHTCNNGKFCGDNFRCFKDGLGRMISIISDGMGTGGKAAVDGAMSTEIMSTMLMAGIGFASAFKTLNSAMMVKSEDESLSALDVISIDLFSGKVNFLKAGAPVTFVRQKKEVMRLDAPSLPIGILTNVNFSQQDILLEENDRILAFSDGLLFDSDEWIIEEFKKWKDQTSDEFCEYILTEAIRRNIHNHDDDITIVAIKMQKDV